MKIVFESIYGEDAKLEIEHLEKNVNLRLLAEDLNYVIAFDRVSLRKFIGALLHVQSSLNKETRHEG